MNPILKMEMIREGRGVRLPMIVIFYNSILAFVTILFLFFNAESLQEGLYYDTSSYLYQYLILSTFQIGMVFMLTPFLVAGFFEEDYESDILNQLLRIPNVAGQYVFAKIFLVMALNLTIFISSLPIIAISCIYCGISLLQLVRLFAMIVIFSFWCGSIAIFFYTTLSRVNGAFFGTLMVESAFLFGTMILEELIRNGSILVSQEMEISSLASKLCVALMALNPLASYFGYYGSITGNVGVMMNVCSRIGIDATDKLFSFVFYKASAVLCILVGIGFIVLTIWRLDKKNQNNIPSY